MKFFVSSTSLTVDTYPAHNEAISGDSLFSIELNYHWRKLIAGLLEKAWRNDLTELSLDNQDYLSALILDLYTAEPLNVGVKSKSLGIDLSTNKTVTSTTYVAVSGSGFYHTFTKPNALIRCSDIIANASVGFLLSIKVDLQGQSPVNQQQADTRAATVRTLSCSHVYEDIPASELLVQLVWKMDAGGTGTMSAGAYLHYEVIEYD